jgi:hypothetical protein
VVISALAFAVTPASPRTSDEGLASGPYYYNAGRRVPIVASTTRVALRTTSASKTGEIASSVETIDGVVGVRDIRAGGIIEVRLASTSSIPSALAAVGRSSGATLLPVFHEPGVERDQSTLFITDDLLVQFRADVTREQIDAALAAQGLSILEPLKYAPNGFHLRVNSADMQRNALSVANALFESGSCIFAHPDFLAYRKLQFIPNDPSFTSQWHLKNTGQGGGTVGADVKAEQAWDITQGSTSISVAVADTGIDWHHEDLEVTMDGGVAKIHDPRDVVHSDNDPFPQTVDADRSHGTAASGVSIAYGNNNLGVSGIAPKCRLVPIQLYAESTFTPNATEAAAFTWAADHADVMSNSWGPDNTGTLLPDATRTAMDYCATNGRGGKGTVIFFAAGNSNINNDTANNNTYASYSGVISVAASTNQDVKASYSSFGPSTSIAAPSNGGTRSITTTDVTGAVGYSSGNYTSTFGGTSSACPLAAGVGALVLSANPNLTWRQVKMVLEQSADKIDPGFGAYDAQGKSLYYGYGRVNALRAVQLAVAGGPDTPGLYNGGTFFIRNSSSPGPASGAFTFGAGTPNFRPIAGDWDGNGTGTIGIYDTSTGTFFLKNSNAGGAADLVFGFGPAAATPLAGDFDGNGSDTIGIYLPATGTFFLKNSNAGGGADLAFQFGPSASSFVPLLGDWDGNGSDTVGLYDPATGNFFLRNSNTPGAANLVFSFGAGGAGFVPVTGDWNNDGVDSVGIYAPSTGAFFVRNTTTSGPADWIYTFGVGGATPLIGNWDGF